MPPSISSNAPPVVITVHGTFAGIENPAEPHWGQVKSQLANDLMARLGADAFMLESFLWRDDERIGPNRESERRRAGERLFQRLQGFETNATPYHLVGHSHGGSVIWHALKASASSDQRLRHLKTWASISTPYLEFGPDRSAWRRLAAAIAVVGGLYWIGFWGLLPDLISGAWLGGFNGLRAKLPLANEINEIRNALGTGPFFGLILAYVAAALIFLLLLVLPLTDLHRRLFTKRKLARAEKLAAEWYAHLWLGLAHPQDEAIAGLKATLIRAPNLVLRPRRGAVYYLVGLIDSAVRAIDEFVWMVLMRNAQGCDIKGAAVQRVGASPQAIAGGLRLLPQDVALRIETKADAAAGIVLSRFRGRLETLSDQADLKTLTGILSGTYDDDSLIHTTMFKDPWIRSAVVDHLTRATSPDGEPTARIPSPRNAIAPFALPLAKAVGAVAAVAIVIAFGASSFGRFVRVETNIAAGERILARFDEAVFQVLENKPVAGEALVRAHRLGVPLPRIFAAACKLTDVDTKTHAYQIIFRELAISGRAEDLLARKNYPACSTDKRPDPNNYQLALALAAALDALAFSKQPPKKLMLDLYGIVEGYIKNGTGDHDPRSIRHRLIPAAVHLEKEDFTRIWAHDAFTIDPTCKTFDAFVTSAARLAIDKPRVDNLEQMISACSPDDKGAAAKLQGRLRLIAVGALPSCDHAEKLSRQASIESPAEEAAVTPRLIECLVRFEQGAKAETLVAETWRLNDNGIGPLLPLKDILPAIPALLHAKRIEAAAHWIKLARDRAEKPSVMSPEIDKKLTLKFANDAAKLEILRTLDKEAHTKFLDELMKEGTKFKTERDFPTSWAKLRQIHAEYIEKGIKQPCTVDSEQLAVAAPIIFLFEPRNVSWSAFEGLLKIDERCKVLFPDRLFEGVFWKLSANADSNDRASHIARVAAFRKTLRLGFVAADSAALPEAILKGYVATVDRLRPSLRVQ